MTELHIAIIIAILFFLMMIVTMVTVWSIKDDTKKMTELLQEIAINTRK